MEALLVKEGGRRLEEVEEREFHYLLKVKVVKRPDVIELEHILIDPTTHSIMKSFKSFIDKDTGLITTIYTKPARRTFSKLLVHEGFYEVLEKHLMDVLDSPEVDNEDKYMLLTYYLLPAYINHKEAPVVFKRLVNKTLKGGGKNDEKKRS